MASRKKQKTIGRAANKPVKRVSEKSIAKSSSKDSKDKSGQLPFFRQYLEPWKKLKTLSFFSVAITDLVFFVLSGQIILLFFSLINYFGNPVQNPPWFAPEDSMKAIVDYAGTVQGFYVTAFILIIALSIVLIAMFSLSRAYIWSVLLGQKFTKEGVFKFF